MATAPPLLSLEEYRHTSYKPDVHFVDGEIEERNVGETHSFCSQRLHRPAVLPHESAWNIEGVMNLRILTGLNRVRVCDVAVISPEASSSNVFEGTPLLCIEVLAFEDQLSQIERVLAEYLAMGVPAILLIDPYERMAYRYDSSGLHPADPTNLCIPNTPICIDLTEPFAKLDRIAPRTNPL